MEFIERLNHVSYNSLFRKYTPIILGKYELSIQCGVTGYSNPRETLDDISKYESMEIGISYKGDNYFCGIDISTIKDFDHFDRKEELLSYKDSDGIFGFVPLDLVDAFFIYLRDMEKIKRGIKLNSILSKLK